MAQPPDETYERSTVLTRIPNTDFANSGTGTTSGQDFIYAWTVVDGYYEIRNNAVGAVSSAMTNPNFPVYADPTEVVLSLQATVGINIVNVASGVDASANTAHWSYSASNTQGGLDVTGNLYTLSAGEFYLPVTGTATQGKYTLPNGLIVEVPGTYTTGMVNYAIMQQPGPWPTGIGANTSGTVPGGMMPVWADLGNNLNAQGAMGLESLTNNWSPQVD